MAELTLEQQRALALARARVRLREQSQQIAPAPKNQSRLGMVDEAMPEGQQPNIGLKGAMRPDDRVQPDLGKSAFRGFTYNVGDEAVASMMAPVVSATDKLPLNEAYQQVRADQNAQEAATREKYPVLNTVSELVGGLANTPKLIGKALEAPTVAEKAVRGFGTGGMLGGIDAFGSGGESLDDRLKSAETGVAAGAGLGVAMPVLGNFLGKTARSIKNFGKPSALQQAAPTLEFWQAEKNRLYNAADTGVGQQRMHPQNFLTLARNTNKIANSRGFGGPFDRISQDLYPKSSSVKAHLNTIASEVQAGKAPPPTWGDLERLRQDLRGAAMDNVRADGTMTKDGELMDEFIDKIDDFMELAPYKEARQAFRIWRKGEVIRDAFYRAQNATAANYTQAGYETALRQQFKRLAQSKNFKRQFNKTEQDAIQRVIDGDTMQNFLRRVGALAPKGAISNMFNLGMTYANPWVGVPLAGATTGARMAATQMGIKKAQDVDALVRNGGVMPQLPAPTPQGSKFLEQAPFGLIPYFAGQAGQ